MQRGTAIAVANIKQHIGSLKPKYEETKKWADQICEDQAFLLKHWRDRLEKLTAIPASRELGQCLRAGQSRGASSRPSHSDMRLQDFVNPKDIQQASGFGQDQYTKFSSRVNELGATYDGVVSKSDRVAEEFQSLTSLSDSEIADRADGLMEEVEVLARKINADYESIRQLPDNPKSLSQASKTAQVHESTFMTSLIQTNEEIRTLFQQIVELKDDITKSSLRHLQQISVVESNIQSIHTLLAGLDVDPESARIFEVLNFAVRLPSIYGSMLVECVRRYEWSEKMTVDSSFLDEGTALQKAEESKRRQKWAKEMSGAVDLSTLDDMTPGVEANLQSQKSFWPNISRQDIDSYTTQLKWVGGFEDAVKVIEELVKSLNAPTKSQTRRAKAFKNGSIHDAAYGRTSLLLRGDEDTMASMKKDKARAEERLKSAESRIRKLEDLLHRQSQYPRPLSATGLGVSNAPTFERHATSPVANFTSALSKARESDPRRTSTSSRRISATLDLEEKSLAQRIVSLEAELIAQKAQSKDLEKNSTARSNAEEILKEQVQEAMSTKEDLLSNFEAQQREFDGERRLFADNNKKLKIRLEELEDEIDRMCNSQDHEFKIQALTEDLDITRRETANEIQRAHDQTEGIRQEYLAEHDKTTQLDQELQRLTEEKFQIQAQANQHSTELRIRDQALIDHHRALRSTLLHVSKDAIAPEDFSALVEAVETVVERSAAHKKELQDALEALKADNAALDTRLSSQGDEIYDLRERLGSEERQVLSMREELEKKTSEHTALQSQLDWAHKQQDESAIRLAAGVTDAGALRERLLEEEKMNAELLSKVEDVEAGKQDLQSKLEEKRSEYASLQGSYVRLNSNRDVQASRADEISTKLFVQSATIQHLLEQVGFTVTKQDDSIVIQKVSRTASGSATLTDPSASMKRSISGPLPTKSDFESLIGADVLHWAKAEDPEQAARQYDEFVKTAASFDMDAFYEAIYRRVKEVEHIARKGQRDARAYRDKAHRAQSEAHDRLALRSFKEGDLALFLPTRDQATKPWAAFNVGAPHYFLREQDSHKLGKRDWLIARISKVEERVVDLSKSMNGLKPSDQRSIEEGVLLDDENPYELSDGLRWYMLDAAEEKPGAPINIGLGKTTVASVNVDAKGSIRLKKASDGNGATRTLARSLDSRRSSTNSKKGLVAIASNSAALEGMVENSSPADATAVHDGEDESRPQSSRTLDVPQTENRHVEEVGIPSPPDW